MVLDILVSTHLLRLELASEVFRLQVMGISHLLWEDQEAIHHLSLVLVKWPLQMLREHLNHHINLYGRDYLFLQLLEDLPIIHIVKIYLP